MWWLAWRQHRVQALSAIVALAAGLLLYGYLAGAWQDSQRLLHAGAPFPYRQVNAVLDLWVWTQIGVLLLPLLAGMFVGAPLFARDLEGGTHRLLMTQGIRARRWGAVSMIGTMAGAIAAAGVLGAAATLLVSNWNGYGPWGTFDEQGVAIVGHAAFAVALGIAAGALVARTIPAMAIVLGSYVAVRAAVTLLRTHYEAPVRVVVPAASQRSPVPIGSWIVGIHFSGGQPDVLYIQPPDRFWTFQAIEAAIFLCLTVALLALAAGFLRRRLA